MQDSAAELEVIRGDITQLRTMIDRALDRGAGRQDPYLLACSDLLYRRKKRLAQLEATLSRSKRADAG